MSNHTGCTACDMKKLQVLMGFDSIGEVARHILSNEDKFASYLVEFSRLFIEREEDNG